MGKWLVLFSGRNTKGQWIIWSGPHETEEEARNNVISGREYKMGGEWRVCQITWEWPEHHREKAQGEAGGEVGEEAG